jgi:Phage portal protein, SPP1 Gp6-like
MGSAMRGGVGRSTAGSAPVIALTPGGWLELLVKRLDDRWMRRMAIPDAYYEGDHDLAFATAKWRETFGGLFRNFADNWMPIVVEASAERLNVQGFRFGAKQEADDAAWEIWQANGMDAQAGMLHEEAVKLGIGYWLIEPPLTPDDPPRITAEHPIQMIVAYASGNRRERLAALKKWTDDAGFVYATLYLPQAIYKWRSQRKAASGLRIDWQRREDDPGGSNPLGVVPVVAVPNNPSLLCEGRSDLTSLIPLQDAINKELSDAFVGSEFLSFPQRVLLGVEIPRDPETGQPVKAAELKASQSRVWAFAAADAKVEQFDAASLTNYIELSGHLLKHLSAQGRIPPHYVMGELVNVNAETIKLAETGLVARVRKKMRSMEEGHEEAMRLAFLAIGDTERAAVTEAETIWKDPEYRSFGELIDGLTKLKTIGVPDEVLWEKAGFSPAEIARMRDFRGLPTRSSSMPTEPPPEEELAPDLPQVA